MKRVLSVISISIIATTMATAASAQELRTAVGSQTSSDAESKATGNSSQSTGKVEPTNRFGVKKSDIATDKELRKVLEPDQKHYLDSGGNDRCSNSSPYNVTPHGFFKKIARGIRHTSHFIGFPADVDKGFGPTCDLQSGFQKDESLKEAAASAPGVRR